MEDSSSDELSVLGDAGDYNSEFEYDSEVERRRAKRSDLAKTEPKKKTKVGHRLEAAEELTRDEGRKDRYHLLSMDAFARHQKFINDYLMYYGGSMKVFQRDKSRDRTDQDVIREHHQFLWSDDDDDNGPQQDSWERRMAKKYYDKLFKEYCIGDLSRYKENKVALRWRIESEVVSGKGQFICGEKHCKEMDGLRSWEVNFAYMEHGVKKSALVKIRLCPGCSRKLNYHHRKREVKASKRKASEVSEVSAKHSKSDSRNHSVSSETGSTSDSSETSVKEVLSNAKDDTRSVDDATATTESEENMWAKPLPPTEEVSREEEFESYFTDMFL